MYIKYITYIVYYLRLQTFPLSNFTKFHRNQIFHQKTFAFINYWSKQNFDVNFITLKYF